MKCFPIVSKIVYTFAQMPSMPDCNQLALLILLLTPLEAISLGLAFLRVVFATPKKSICQLETLELLTKEEKNVNHICSKLNIICYLAKVVFWRV